MASQISKRGKQRLRSILRVVRGESAKLKAASGEVFLLKAVKPRELKVRRAVEQ